jgi:hypothetical protein
MPADNGRFCLFTEILVGTPHRDLVLADVSAEYEAPMRCFPLRRRGKHGHSFVYTGGELSQLTLLAGCRGATATRPLLVFDEAAGDPVERP